MYKILLLLVALSVTTPCWSKTAICTIEIYDGIGDTKYTVEKSFEEQRTLTPVEHKDFKLPGSDYFCALGFHSLGSGTNLVCFFDDSRNNFVQSDRTIIEEYPARNNLIIILGAKEYFLESSCK